MGVLVNGQRAPIRFGMAIAGVTAVLLVTSISAWSQNQRAPLNGRVTANQTLPADEIAAGGANCDWNNGACDMLKGYLVAGADPSCIQTLRQAVELERQRNALALTSPPVGHDPVLIQKIVDLNKQIAALIGFPRFPGNCLQAANGRPNWPKPVNSPDDIPIGPFGIPEELKGIKGAKDFVERAIRTVIQQAPDALRFGPDWPAYEELRIRYAKDAIEQSGYQNSKDLVKQMQSLVGNRQNASAFDKQLKNFDADMYLNSVDMNNIRQQAMRILETAAVNNPGMAVDNGLQTLLNYDFPPVQ